MIFQLQVIAFLHQGTAEKRKNHHADGCADKSVRPISTKKLQDFLPCSIAGTYHECTIGTSKNNNIFQTCLACLIDIQCVFPLFHIKLDKFLAQIFPTLCPEFAFNSGNACK